MPTDEAPLPGYDDLTTGAIESHARTLDAEGLRALLAYEQEHADRIQVVQVLEQRLADVEAGASPSDGDPASSQAQAPPSPTAAPKAAPQTEGPPQNPPSQGVPTNPTQPRR